MWGYMPDLSWPLRPEPALFFLMCFGCAHRDSGFMARPGEKQCRVKRREEVESDA